MAPFNPAAEGVRLAAMHTGLSEARIKADYTQVELGELKFIARKAGAGLVPEASEVSGGAPADHATATTWKAGLLLSEYIREHPHATIAGERAATRLEPAGGVDGLFCQLAGR